MSESKIRTLGAYVRECRERRGMSLTMLAAEAELSKSELSALENGKIALPGAVKRRRLAAALGVPHLDLLIAAGELEPEEVTASGVMGVAVTDPVREGLLDKLRRAPLTDPDYVRGLDGVLSMFLTGDLIEHGRRTGNVGAAK